MIRRKTGNVGRINCGFALRLTIQEEITLILAGFRRFKSVNYPILSISTVLGSLIAQFSL